MMLYHSMTKILVMLEYIEDGVVYRVGQNAEENWILIKQSQDSDMWFHLYGHPSPHVIMSVPLHLHMERRMINHAAMLCKTHSKFKSHHRVNIIYTEIRNLSFGDKVGSVKTKHVRKLCI